MLTVTTAASDLSLLSLAELRAAAGVTDASQDAALTALGARVAAAITAECRVAAGGVVPPTLRHETLTETFRLRSSVESLILSRRPVTAITSVTEGDDDPLTVADYEFDAASGLLYRLDGDDARTCWSSCNKVVAVYTAGWATVPEDLKLAASKLVTVFWLETARDPNLRRVSVAGISEREYWVAPSSDPAMPAEVIDLLRPYMNHWIA
jgi:hypothetical protein